MASNITLHDGTAFDASAATLKGAEIQTERFPAVLVWFTPAASYDGTVYFEISPDDGTTWFETSAYITDSVFVLVTSVAAPVATDLYVALVPSDNVFRVRMSGGSQGSLTVEAQKVFVR